MNTALSDRAVIRWARWLRSRVGLIFVGAALVTIWFVIVPLALVAWSLAKDVHEVPDMLRAIAALWWPLIAGLVLVAVAPELPRIVQRLRRATWGSGAIELDPETRDVEAKVERAEAEQAAASIPIEAIPTDAGAASEIGPTEAELLSGPDRGLAFLRVAASLEDALQALGAISGVTRTRGMPFIRLVSALESSNLLSDDVAGALVAFWRARNRLIHGREPLQERDLTALLDSGARLLRVVRSIRLTALLGEQVYRVRSVVQLYTDRNTSLPDPKWRGVILEPATVLSPSVETTLIFPTQLQMTEGALVNLKFASEPRIGVRWYQDPVDGSVRKAWNVATPFIGEGVDEPSPGSGP